MAKRGTISSNGDSNRNLKILQAATEALKNGAVSNYKAGQSTGYVTKPSEISKNLSSGGSTITPIITPSNVKTDSTKSTGKIGSFFSKKTDNSATKEWLYDEMAPYESAKNQKKEKSADEVLFDKYVKVIKKYTNDDSWLYDEMSPYRTEEDAIEYENAVNGLKGMGYTDEDIETIKSDGTIGSTIKAGAEEVASGFLGTAATLLRGGTQEGKNGDWMYDEMAPYRTEEENKRIEQEKQKKEEDRVAKLDSLATQLEASYDALSQEAAKSSQFATGGVGDVGKLFVEAGIAGVGMASDAIVNAIAPGLGLAAMGVRVFGNASQETRQYIEENGNQRENLSEFDQMMLVGVSKALVEVVSEKIGGPFEKVYGNTAMGKFTSKFVDAMAKNPYASTMLKVLTDFNEEGLEEVFSGILEPFINTIYQDISLGESLKDPSFYGELFEQYLVGGIMGGVGGVGNAISTNSQYAQAYGPISQEILYDAKQLNNDSQAAKLAARQISKSGKASGTVLKTLTDENNAIRANQAYESLVPAVESRLREVGVDPESAEKDAQIIARQSVYKGLDTLVKANGDTNVLDKAAQLIASNVTDENIKSALGKTSELTKREKSILSVYKNTQIVLDELERSSEGENVQWVSDAMQDFADGIRQSGEAYVTARVLNMQQAIKNAVSKHTPLKWTMQQTSAGTFGNNEKNYETLRWDSIGHNPNSPWVAGEVKKAGTERAIQTLMRGKAATREEAERVVNEYERRYGDGRTESRNTVLDKGQERVSDKRSQEQSEGMGNGAVQYNDKGQGLVKGSLRVFSKGRVETEAKEVEDAKANIITAETVKNLVGISKLEKKAKELGATIQYAVGLFDTGIKDENGNVVLGNGVTLPSGTIIVRVDDPEYTAEQIGLHELFHARSMKNPKTVNGILSHLFEKMDEKKVNEVIKEKYDDTHGCYIRAVDGNYDTNPDGYREEFIADMLAGMNRCDFSEEDFKKWRKSFSAAEKAYSAEETESESAESEETTEETEVKEEENKPEATFENPVVADAPVEVPVVEEVVTDEETTKKETKQTKGKKQSKAETELTNFVNSVVNSTEYSYSYKMKSLLEKLNDYYDFDPQRFIIMDGLFKVIDSGPSRNNYIPKSIKNEMSGSNQAKPATGTTGTNISINAEAKKNIEKAKRKAFVKLGTDADDNPVVGITQGTFAVSLNSKDYESNKEDGVTDGDINLNPYLSAFDKAVRITTPPIIRNNADKKNPDLLFFKPDGSNEIEGFSKSLIKSIDVGGAFYLARVGISPVIFSIDKDGELYGFALGVMNKRDKTENQLLAKEFEVMEQYDEWKKNQQPTEKRKTKASIVSISNAAGLELKIDKDNIFRYYVDGKEINNVTAEHIERESAIGTLINIAYMRGFLDEKDENGKVIKGSGVANAQKQYQGVADLMNMVIHTNDPEMVWEVVGASIFSAVKTNSDGQYSRTIDFSTVCRKTQDMITAMSARMKTLKRGLSKEEVTQLQQELVSAGLNVPCPVCYVFSRWAGIGSVLNKMKYWQEKFADYTDEQIQARIDELQEKLYKDPTTIEEEETDSDSEEETEEKEKKKNTFKIANLRKLLLEEDEYYYDLTASRERLEFDIAEKKSERSKLKRKKKRSETEESTLKHLNLIISTNEARLKSIKDELSDIEKKGLGELSWLKRVRSKPGYKPVNDDVLFDLDAGEKFAKEYPLSWKYRTTRGAGMGKAILPYADFRVGDLILGPGKNSADGNKLFDNVKGNLTKEQQKVFDAAVKRAKAQNLIGGQRYQSTSDFRYDYALDYILSFFEMQALGYNLQTYTKVLEYGEMIASIGGDVNLSVMPRNAGYENGHLIYSSVTGIDADGAIKLSHMYDNVQLILVGINDEHIKLALRDSEETGGIEIGFVIPYHSSGASIENFIKELVSHLGENFVKENYQSYEDVQTDHKYKKSTEKQKKLRDIRKKILTKTSDNKDSLTNEELKLISGTSIDISDKSFEYLRDVEERALKGEEDAVLEYSSWTAGALKDLYNKLRKTDVKEQFTLTSAQAEAIMPHEYWNTEVDREHAYINGILFRSYCFNLGLHPRFTGKAKEGTEVKFGDFSGEKGYWKLLIDRPMYKNDGTYREQTSVNMTNFNNDMAKKEYAEEHWGEYKLKEPNKAKAAEIGAMVGEQSEKKAKASIASENTRPANNQRSIDDELEISDPRTLPTGYEKVSNALMGFSKDSTKNKSYEEQKYKYNLDLWVSVDGGYTYSKDSIKGMNRLHAIERARRNWGTTDDGIIIRERTDEKSPDQEALEIINSQAPKGNTQNLYNNKSIDIKLSLPKVTDRLRPFMGTVFSGAGTLEAALSYLEFYKEFAVEYNKKIAAVYTNNFGEEHMYVGDVRDFDSKKKSQVFYLHASPVCKNFSAAKINSGETTIDISTAQATARILEEQMPTVFTVENVKRYKNSEAYKIITDKLDALGYKWDAEVYNSVNYGAATSRERLIIRAVKNGELPSAPETSSGKTWYDVTSDLIDELPEVTMPNWMKERYDAGNYKTDLPLLILGGNKGKKLTTAYSDSPAPTILARSSDARIVMPDGRILKATPRVLARIQGLPDEFDLPDAVTRAYTVVGNGIPTQLTKAVVGGLLENEMSKTNKTGAKASLVSKEEDNAYMKAVESGDMETVQKMVDDAAKKAGYIETWNHGSKDANFTVFDVGKSEYGLATFLSDRGTASSYAETTDKPIETRLIGKPITSVADAIKEIERIQGGTVENKDGKYVYRRFGYSSVFDNDDELIHRANSVRRAIPGGVYKLYVKLGKRLTVDANNAWWNEIKSEYGKSTDAIAKKAKSLGYDSVLIERVHDSNIVSELPNDVLITFNPQAQLKSADPVTYDDDGKVIPLSERFNEKKKDIRLSLGYHAGDLGKSTRDGYPMGGRSSGHFGSGTYFVGNEKKINDDSDYGKRKHETVEFDNYNLYKPTTNADGSNLHDALKRLNDIGSNLYTYEPLWDDSVFKKFERKVSDAISNMDGFDADADAAREIVKDFITKYGDKSEFDEALEKAQKQYDLAHKDGVSEDDIAGFKEFYEKFESWGRSEEEYVKEETKKLEKKIEEAKAWDGESLSVDDWLYSSYYMEKLAKKTLEDVGAKRKEYSILIRELETALEHQYTVEQIEENLKKVYDTINSYEDWEHNYYDSASTVFMKNFGYEGIDVRHLDKFDNTRYGSVIYDLKGEDLARKKEIGTAKYSLPNPTVDDDVKKIMKKYDAMYGKGATEKVLTEYRQVIDAYDQAYQTFLRQSRSNAGIGSMSARGQALGIPLYKAVNTADVQAEYTRLQNTYGVVPQTDKNAVRTVESPKSVTGTDKVTKAATTVMGSEAFPDNKVDSVKELIVNGKLSYNPVENKVLERKVIAEIKNKGFEDTLKTWREDIQAGLVSAELVAKGAVLLNEVSNNPNATPETFADVMTDYCRLLHNAGQSLQAAKVFQQLSPDGTLFMLIRQANRLTDELRRRGFDNDQYPNVVIPKAYIDAYKNAQTDVEREQIIQDIEQVIADQIPATFMEKLRAWRYLAMLGNARTQVRNVLGNVGYQPMRMTKVIFSGLAESLLEKAGVNVERTQSVVRDRETLDVARQLFEEDRNLIMFNGNESQANNIMREINDKRTIFKNKFLEGYRNVTNKAMDMGDAVFCSFTYSSALSRYIAANHTTWSQASDELKDKARQFAIKEAAEATYRDSNAFADAISKLGRRAKINGVDAGFGAVMEGILPFRKTPANILVRAIEYSPVGLFIATGKTVNAVKGKTSASEAVNAGAKGLTGTMLVMLGVMLKALGYLQGKRPDDDKEATRFDLEGHQEYSIEIGNKSYTIDWLAPASIPLFLGANLADAFTGEGMTTEEVITAVLSITDPLLEMSMLQGVNDALSNVSKYGTDDAALVNFVGNALWSYATQFIPSWFGQLDRSMNNTRQQTYVDKNNTVIPTNIQRLIGKLSAKIPGWDYAQIDYIDAWGRREQKADSALWNVISQFLSPGYSSTIQTSDMEQELARLYDATSNSSVLISTPNHYFDYNGERKNLTGDEYVTYAVTRGQTAYRLATDLVESDVYANMTDEQRIKAISTVYEYANEVGKMNVIGDDYELDGWVENAQSAENYGVDTSTYIAAKASIAGIDGLKDKNGDTVKNSSGVLKMQSLYSLGLDEKTTRELAEALGIGSETNKLTKAQVEQRMKLNNRLYGEYN